MLAALALAAGLTLADLSGTDVEGERWSRERVAGKVVLVDVWATWCPPCLAELPQLRELEKTYGARGFAVVGVSLDTLSRRELRSWLGRQGVSWPQLYDGRGFAGELAQRWGIDRVPRSFLFDRRGRLVAVDLPVSALPAAVSGLLQISTARSPAPPPTPRSGTRCSFQGRTSPNPSGTF